MSERTCIPTGKTLPRHNLLRFVAGPDGVATLDIAEKLPGRGAWIAADEAALQKAVKKGHFTRTIGAGFGEIDAEIDRIKRLMRDRVIACASMARRAGLLIGGAGKLLAGGQCTGLLIAPDASEREARRLQSRLGTSWVTNCLSASEIGQICGRESLAFAGLLAPEHKAQENLCRNLHLEIARMEGFYASAGCNQQPDGCIT